MGLYIIETYIAGSQNIIAKYITTHPILKLCLAAERQPGARFTKTMVVTGGAGLGGRVGGGKGYIGDRDGDR